MDNEQGEWVIVPPDQPPENKTVIEEHHVYENYGEHEEEKKVPVTVEPNATQKEVVISPLLLSRESERERYPPFICNERQLMLRRYGIKQTPTDEYIPKSIRSRPLPELPKRKKGIRNLSTKRKQVK